MSSYLVCGVRNIAHILPCLHCGKSVLLTRYIGMLACRHQCCSLMYGVSCSACHIVRSATVTSSCPISAFEGSHHTSWIQFSGFHAWLEASAASAGKGVLGLSGPHSNCHETCILRLKWLQIRRQDHTPSHDHESLSRHM